MSCSGRIQIDISMRGGNGHIFQLHDRDTLERHYVDEDYPATLAELERLCGLAMPALEALGQ